MGYILTLLRHSREIPLDFRRTGSEWRSLLMDRDLAMDGIATNASTGHNPNAAALYADSSLRETIIEYGFVGELLRVLWRHGRRDIEVLRAEVDRGGYDLVLHCNGVSRHVQLKSSHRKAATAKVTVNLKLAEQLSGCVVWIMFDQETLELGPFLWFGGKPGDRIADLGTKVARHTKANSRGSKTARPGLRVIPRASFTKLESMAAVIDRLFGTLQENSPS
jgi:hypothetical protein